MSALEHIRSYLAEHFAGHDIEGLMEKFEAAIEAKVEEGMAGVRQEIEALRDELTGGRPAMAEPAPEPAPISPGKAAEIEELPPIARPDAIVEAQSESAQ